VDRRVFSTQFLGPLSQVDTLHGARFVVRHAPDRATGRAMKHGLVDCGNGVQPPRVGGAAKATRQLGRQASHMPPLVKLLRHEEVADPWGTGTVERTAILARADAVALQDRRC
jgi:hypothetical protein